jgi:ankyrin repeat protein
LPECAEYTLLELSVHYGRSSIVEILLKSGADPNRQPTNPMADTPLHIAIKRGYKKIIDLLVSANAGEDVLNND